MTAPTPPTTPYSVRGPLDLVALVPVVLGFHPDDSVVLLTFGPPGRSLQARADLPLSTAEQEQTASDLAEAVRRHGLRQAAVVLYSDDEQACEAMAESLRRRLRGVDCEPLDVIRTESDGLRGRWFRVPDDGLGGSSYDLAAHPFTARLVLTGRVIRRDRAELADSLVGTDDDDAQTVSAAATRHADLLLRDLGHDTGPGVGAEAREPEPLGTEARWVRRRVRRWVGGHGAGSPSSPLGPGDAGRLLVLLAISSVRDVAWAQIHRRGKAADLPAHLALWSDLVRRAPYELVPGPAALLAFAAWQYGDGALAWCAVDRALEADPDHTLAQLVASALSRAVSPDLWEPVAGDDLPVLMPGP